MMEANNLSDPNIAGQPEVVEEQASIWSIIMGIFTSPSKAFAEYAKKPSIIVALVLTIVLAAGLHSVMTPYSAQAQYDIMKKSTVLPAQALDEMRDGIENPNLVQGALFGAAGVILAGVVLSLVAWFIGSFLFGGKASFKAIWGVNLLAGLISIIGGLLIIPMVMAKDSAYVSIGLAALFPDKDFTSIIYSVLFYCDAFMIWGIIVAGIGYAAVLGISRGKGYAVSVITSGFAIVVMIALTAVGMSFAGVEISLF